MKQSKFESIRDLPLKIRSKYSSDKNVNLEDRRLLDAVIATKDKVNVVESQLNNVTDELLINGLVYELKSLQVKHDYLIQECKERGLTADFY